MRLLYLARENKLGLSVRCCNHGGFFVVVQLGGLEPPTSCSTDRRSNQLSYNCILGRALKRGSRTGGKLGASQRFGKAGRAASSASFRCKPGPTRLPNVSPCSAFFDVHATCKKPGLAARAFFGAENTRFCDWKTRQNARGSGGRLEQLGRVGLDRFDGFGRNPLAQFGELLGIGREGLELLAGVRRPQLQPFGGRFHAEQRLREVEVRRGVGLHDFDQLGGEFAGALAGGREYRHHGAVMAFGDVLELGVVVAGLGDALFGEGAHLLGNFERDHGGGERIGGIRHGMHLSETGGWKCDPNARQH
jgi:hypothetical protein